MLAAKPRPHNAAPSRPQPDATTEGWLRDEVLPVYDAMQADPSRGIPSDRAVAALEAHHAKRLKKAQSGA